MTARSWLVLVTRLSGRRAAQRMRLWRALKAAGAAMLRDGVYVLPLSEQAGVVFDEQVSAIEAADGNAHVLPVARLDERTERQFVGLFDRSEDYLAWHSELLAFEEALPALAEPDARRTENRLRRAFETIVAGDFFTNDTQADYRSELERLAARVNATFSPDEPQFSGLAVVVRNRDDYQRRVWATRRGLWVDRIASAWLIRRLIDAEPEFLWLASPDDCPQHAVGFDFDGAEFTHAGSLVTFEVLVRSFELHHDPALRKLGALVHYVDVGGPVVPDAAGLVTMLAGIKRGCTSDDVLLDTASPVFDHFYTAYAERDEEKSNENGPDTHLSASDAQANRETSS